MTSSDVIDVLRNGRYAAPEWFALEEVPPEKGALNHLDLVAWNLFASRGLRSEGVEIKVSRGDWLRELKKPEKAEATHGMVNHFYVCATAAVVHAEEVPGPWGWLEIQGSRCVTKKKAPIMRRGPYEIEELAGIFRRILSTWMPPQKFAAEVKRASERGASSRKYYEEAYEAEHKRTIELSDQLREIDKVLGFSRWENGERCPRVEMAKRFRCLLDVLGDRKAAEVLGSAIHTVGELLRATGKSIDDAAVLLRELAATPGSNPSAVEEARA